MTTEQEKEQLLEYWKAVIEENHSALTRYLRLRVRDQTVVEDIIHDAFIRLSKIERSYDIQNSKAYLFRTAISVMIDQMRKNERQSRLESEYRKTQEVNNYRSSGEKTEQEAHIENNQRLVVILASLDALPQKCRTAFLLYRFHNLKQQEIAAKLGVSVNSVERYIIRAMTRCKDALNAKGLGW